MYFYLGIFLCACYLREGLLYFIYFILIVYHAHLDKVFRKCNMTYLFLDVSLHFLRFSLLLLPLFRSASFFKTGGPLSRRSFYGRICNFKLTGSRAAPRDASTPVALQRGSRTVKFRGLFYCPLYDARYADKKNDGSFP